MCELLLRAEEHFSRISKQLGISETTSAITFKTFSAPLRRIPPNQALGPAEALMQLSASNIADVHIAHAAEQGEKTVYHPDGSFVDRRLAEASDDGPCGNRSE